ncbi:hypothetical protein PHYBLDRAFT_72398 [Phycomyces blakesleeanus NRRL 1555(-)]|uniref:Uncharacterized protein n=1 Tax=Phycomyces blakesleeanus (strain ATCC 8743b / DSM 1359 / FGSC 10004 / NBRC 33097 / NRRL 1555) TaxID=763407 RepID=A0A167JC63_PHYB8|nr:hypothetical protein PHYBLDRAFT_72398 [Phycomyces blakesleeanus NRRL 1555(-)]OAD65688.1 hypothetical protein PHYBLDRAFT_72398 [Phycomyces blakesleeanus NRRL 1555(-)]|eukprot:XP_018283728.1 hypothetical protein PHYBLDRAFT_72398 [Phycomyces blakesleeanus NRRL 1555(-)]
MAFFSKKRINAVGQLMRLNRRLIQSDYYSASAFYFIFTVTVHDHIPESPLLNARFICFLAFYMEFTELEILKVLSNGKSAAAKKQSTPAVVVETCQLMRTSYCVKYKKNKSS